MCCFIRAHDLAIPRKLSLKKKIGHAGFAGHMLTHADRRTLTCVLLIGVFNDSQTCAAHDYKEIRYVECAVAENKAVVVSLTPRAMQRAGKATGMENLDGGSCILTKGSTRGSPYKFARSFPAVS